MIKNVKRLIKKHRQFKQPVAEIIKVADALVQGHEGGWVSISANAYGRQCIEKVFPDAHIAWREHENEIDPAPDWRGFSLNLPDVGNAMRHHLPPIYDRPLHESSPDSLAFLLACAIRDQGGCAAFVRHDGGRVKIDLLTKGLQ